MKISIIPLPLMKEGGLACILTTHLPAGLPAWLAHSLPLLFSGGGEIVKCDQGKVGSWGRTMLTNLGRERGDGGREAGRRLVYGFRQHFLCLSVFNWNSIFLHSVLRRPEPRP